MNEWIDAPKKEFVQDVRSQFVSAPRDAALQTRKEKEALPSAPKVAAERERLIILDALLRSLPSDVQERARDKIPSLMLETGENYVEALAGKVPYAEQVILAAKLATAFGDGIEKGIAKANAELGWDERIERVRIEPAQGLTEQERDELKRIRGWLDANRQKFKAIVGEGIRSTVRAFVEELAMEVVGGVAGKLVDPLADSIGDFVGDLFTGDYIKRIDFLTQSQEDLVQGTVAFHSKLLYVSFVQAIAARAIGEGSGSEVDAALADPQIPKPLRETDPATRQILRTQAEFQVRLNRLIERLHKELADAAQWRIGQLEKLFHVIYQTYPVFGIAESYGLNPDPNIYPEYSQGIVRINGEYERRKLAVQRRFDREKRQLARELNIRIP